MIDLRDDGTIAIDFENGGETVVLGRPKFGAYKRLRAEHTRLIGEGAAYRTELEGKEPKSPKTEIDAAMNEWSEKVVIAWWELVLTGDATFVKLTTSGTVPATDDWPPYLIYGPGVIVEVLNHWHKVPLARGGNLVPEAERSIESRMAELAAQIQAMTN